MTRLAPTFDRLRQQGTAAFVPFIMAADPAPAFSRTVLHGLPGIGADIIELGIPFSDPMADGVAIQAAGLRSLKHGTNIADILAMVQDFRTHNNHTPIVLMGYYNPVYRYGVSRFATDAAAAGVDGVIIVDVPPEEEAECAPFLRDKGIDFVRLLAPTTPPARLTVLCAHASGFVYHISVRGVTGTQSASLDDVRRAVAGIRQHTTLPVGLGFGVNTPEQAESFAGIADAVIVGSSIVRQMDGSKEAVEVLAYAKTLADAVHRPRKPL